MEDDHLLGQALTSGMDAQASVIRDPTKIFISRGRMTPPDTAAETPIPKSG
jgi:hypothetical protein